MPERQRTPRRYLSLDKEKGGLKEKLDGDRLHHMDWFDGQLVDFCFRDNTYQGRTNRQLEIRMVDVDADGQKIEVIIRTGSAVWIDGFLNLLPSLPGPGDLGAQEYVGIGAFRPSDKDYLYCMLQYVRGGVGSRVSKTYDAEQTKSWCADPYNPTAEERETKELRLLAACVRWMRQHLDPQAVVNYYDTEGRLRQAYDDGHYVAPEAGEAQSPAGDAPASQPSPGGTSLADFINKVKAIADPIMASADEVVMGERDKARAFLQHYQTIWKRISSSKTPHTEADVLAASSYKSGNWPAIIDYIVQRQIALGVIEPPEDPKLPGEDSVEGAPIEDDLPF